MRELFRATGTVHSSLISVTKTCVLRRALALLIRSSPTVVNPHQLSGARTSFSNIALVTYSAHAKSSWRV